MKTLKYILLLMIVPMVFACQKDPLKEISPDGKWNKERNITGIRFEKQVGPATITRDGDNAVIEFVALGDVSKLKVVSIDLSLRAKSDVKPGDELSFSGDDNSTTINITSQAGESLSWKVIAKQYQNMYEGTWTIQDMRIYWDDWNGWGLQGESQMKGVMPNVETGLDDKIIFSPLEGEENGSFFGNYERTAGTDGKFASYISQEGNDWSDMFGGLPAGKGKYYINPDNTVSIQVGDKKYETKGITSGTSPAQFDMITKQNLGSIDWGNYYGGENKLRAVWRLWYILNK